MKTGTTVEGFLAALDDRIVGRAAGVFRSWQTQSADVLETSGVFHDEADDLGGLLIAACEGAVVLSRAERSLAPLGQAERSLRRFAADSARD